MKILSITQKVNEDLKPVIIANLEIPLELLQDHYSTFHRNDFYQHIGKQLIEAIQLTNKEAK